MAEVALRDYLTEIDNLIEHGSIEAALQHSRHILLQHPRTVEVYRLMGKALLEREDDRAAQDIFQRVLSVDPEDFVARVGLSIVHDRNEELDQAIWHMERAFAIAPSNDLIQGELRRLYARRDGDSPERIPLTRDALARMYAQGDLNAEAIADLRNLLREQPDRIDLQVEMAEVLWRDEQRVDAAEFAQSVLSTLPYCLKANLIMGAILRDSGADDESEESLQRAQAVDPENMFAAAFFGSQVILAPQPVLVDRLEMQTVSDRLDAPEMIDQEEAVPAWLRGVSDVEQPLLPESELEHAPRLGAGLHMPDTATEIPDWLQGLTAQPSSAEAEVPAWLATLTGAAVAGAVGRELTDRESAQSEELAVASTDAEVPDWISQLSNTGTLTPPEPLPPAEKEDEQPDWMAQLREEPLAPYSETISVAEDSETPDWLAALAGSAAVHAISEGEEAAPEATADVTDETGREAIAPASSDEQPDWLAQLRETQPAPYSETIAASEDTQTPDWLEQLHVSSSQLEAEPEASAFDLRKAAGVGLAGVALFAGREGEGEETVTGPEMPAPISVEPTPEASTDVVESAAPGVPEEMPSADDALAFLAKLAAGKEDQLRAQAQAEADVRMDSIMGRKPAEPAREGQPVIRLATTGAAAVGLAAAATKLKNKLEQPETPMPVKDQAVPESTPEVPEEMPSADDALAFLAKLAAGKEDQLRAEAQQEADARMATIMGRKPVEPAAQPVAPAPQVAESAPEVPEEMPSADDALAFLARLAAGKEDQLRAEAQQEADARMDAIMGRKPAAEAKPSPAEKTDSGVPVAAVGAAALAGLMATKKEPSAPPPAVPEEMPSADDALAFLAKLAAGKEDQLRAQAQQEADARMNAIMGRSAPVEPAAPIAPEIPPALEVEAPPAEESTEWVTDLSVAAEPLPADELPDWLQAMRPADETLTAEPADELPEWLQAMRPVESAETPGLTALFEEDTETETDLAATAPTTDLPDWLRSIRPVEPAWEDASSAPGLATIESGEEQEPSTEDLLAELAALEQAAAGTEVESMVPAVILSQDWWSQTAEDTGEEPLNELPEPFLSQRARAAEKEKERAAAGPAKPKSAASTAKRTGPLHPAKTGPLPYAGPQGIPETVPASPELEDLVARVSGDNKNYEARLELARTYWATGNRAGAYTEYLEVASAGEFTKELISDLETIVEIYNRPDWHRLLGDVCMKAGKLSQALEHYRLALNEL